MIDLCGGWRSGQIYLKRLRNRVYMYTHWVEKLFMLYIYICITCFGDWTTEMRCLLWDLNLYHLVKNKALVPAEVKR